MTPALSKLRANLSAQITLTQELAQLTAREHAAIVAADWAGVQTLAETRASRVERLQALTRELLSANASGSSLEQRLREADLVQEWRQLRTAAEQLQQANRGNRALLDARRQRFATTLRVLGRGDAAPVYGRGASTGFGKLGQRLASA
jgi:flagellar biosynthesis/type III secretory pathway chaperone